MEHVPDYQVLICKTKRCAMNVHGLRMLAIEFTCSTDKINPDYIQNLFNKNPRSKRRPNEFIIPFHNTAVSGVKNINPLNTGGTSNVCLLTKFCRVATVCGIIIYTKFQNN